ncbi:helix-turn-helix domain-containing protein [Chitinophagaceae bacterium LWZ2-11]
MLIESTQIGGMLATLEKFSGGKIVNRELVFPPSFGKGYIKNYDLGPLMHVMVHKYVLNEEIVIKKTAGEIGKELITFSFRNLIPQHRNAAITPMQQLISGSTVPSVQVSSGNIYFEVLTPAQTNINTIIITVHTKLLKDLLNKQEENKLIQNIISRDQSYLYDRLISSPIQQVASKIFDADKPDQLGDFYVKIKAQEMIYLFFTELLKRPQTTNYPINTSDVKVMYSIQEKIMADLSLQPNLKELSDFSNMSESKMNKLFKQIFGQSIYNYYQTLRMNEAAGLIKTGGLSISEAGYRMGFTNLSHFTRLFEKHIGLKPKKYSISFRDESGSDGEPANDLQADNL